MSRPSDTLRGARLAYGHAYRLLAQSDLFPATLAAVDRQFWVGIRDRALAAIEEETWARRIQQEAAR